MVGGGPFGPQFGEPDDLSVFHQLQPEEGVVSFLGANPHSELARLQWKCMDCARRRRHRPGVRFGTSAGKYFRAVLWKRRSSCQWFALGNAALDGFPLSQSAE